MPQFRDMERQKKIPASGDFLNKLVTEVY